MLYWCLNRFQFDANLLSCADYWTGSVEYTFFRNKWHKLLFGQTTRIKAMLHSKNGFWLNCSSAVHVCGSLLSSLSLYVEGLPPVCCACPYSCPCYVNTSQEYWLHFFDELTDLALQCTNSIFIYAINNWQSDPNDNTPDDNRTSRKQCGWVWCWFIALTPFYDTGKLK